MKPPLALSHSVLFQSFFAAVLVFACFCVVEVNCISKWQLARAENLRRQQPQQQQYASPGQSYGRNFNPLRRDEKDGLHEGESSYIDDEYYQSGPIQRGGRTGRGRSGNGPVRVKDTWDPNCNATCTSYAESTYFH